MYVQKYKKWSRKYPPWYTPDIIQNIRTKEYYYKKFGKHASQYFYNEFSGLRRIIKLQIQKAYNHYLHSIEYSLITDTKKFWLFVQNKKGTTIIPGKNLL